MASDQGSGSTALIETAQQFGSLKAAVWMFLNGVTDKAALQAAYDAAEKWQDSDLDAARKNRQGEVRK